MAGNLHDRINQRGTAEAWANILIEKWQKAIKDKGIGVTGDLANSFSREIQSAGSDVKAIIMRFNFYGRFRDMGVGRGLRAYERGTNKSNLIASKRYGADVSFVGRQPKKWYNKIKTAQTYRLGEILATAEGQAIVNNIEADFSNSITIKM